MSNRTKVVMMLTALAVIFIMVLALSSDQKVQAQWTEPNIPYGMVSWNDINDINDLFDRQLLDPGKGNDEGEADTDDSAPAETPRQTRAKWLGTRCYPNTPNRAPNYDILRGDFNRGKGWVQPQHELSDAIEVDLKIMAVYRDILRLSVRSVDVWMFPENANPCGTDTPIWISMGSAVAMYQLGDKMIWFTADHVTHMDVYSGGWDMGALQISGTDAVTLPSQPNFRVGVMITPAVPDVIPLANLFRSNYADNLEALFYPPEDLLAGQKIYQPWTTLGFDCLGTILDQERCVVTYPHVTTGHVTSVVPKYGEMGATFTAQIDIVGGASGSPSLVFQDNGDDLINGMDFRIVGVANTGWPSGVSGIQGVYYKDLMLVIQYLESLESIWN